MEKLCNINPVWFILAVNVIAAFLVPFLTYRYAHKNNLKTLREKWISEFRGSSSAYVEACSNLYYANDMRYQKLSNTNALSNAERAGYIKRCEEAQAKVTAAWARVRLLFKEGDSDFQCLGPLFETFRKSADEPSKNGSQFHMEPKPWNSAQDDFLKACNAILATEWGKITK